MSARAICRAQKNILHQFIKNRFTVYLRRKGRMRVRSQLWRDIKPLQMLHYFINLPSVLAYRSPKRNKYCRGPILAYWPRKLPAHEFLLSGKEKDANPGQWICPVLYLGDFVAFCCSGALNLALQFLLSLNEFIQGSIYSSSPKAHQWASALADTLANFCSLQLQTSPTPQDSPLADVPNPPSPVRPHSAETFSGAQRRYTRPSLRGTSGEMEGGDGIQSEVRSCAAQQQHTAAQPLLSSLLPGEKLTHGI